MCKSSLKGVIVGMAHKWLLQVEFSFATQEEADEMWEYLNTQEPGEGNSVQVGQIREVEDVQEASSPSS